MARHLYPPTHSVSGVGLQALKMGENENTTVIDDAREKLDEQPGKRSPFDKESDEESPRRSKFCIPGHLQGNSDPEIHGSYDTQRPKVFKKQLWSAENNVVVPRTLYNNTNIALIQARKPGHGQPSPTNSIHQNAPAQQTPVIAAHSASFDQLAGDSEETYDFIKQPESRLISQEQLVSEVKGIYAGLVMVEAKCIEVDNKQAAVAQTDGAQKLIHEQWQAFIALYSTLLNEHHDFFLASQHPSASPALRRLASKYAMPARMWRHGIHSFWELLRHRFPASGEHMLSFIYLAYSIMALLYETVPVFEDTWIECLGDLGRYRMAIEEDDLKDREVWTKVARHWYSKASNPAPTKGRLYHHLAILARPNALQQLFYYASSFVGRIEQRKYDKYTPKTLKEENTYLWLSNLYDRWGKASLAMFKRLEGLNYPLYFLSLSWIPIVSAAPSTRPPESRSTGLSQYFKGFWKHFTNELAGPFVFNTALVMIASICYACFTSYRLAWLMPYAQGGASISTFYAGFNEKLSSYQLAGCCIFTYALSQRYLNDKTDRLPASRGIIRMSITTLSLLLSLTTAYFSPMVEGRYSSWQVAGGIASLPVTSFLILAWVTLFLDTGIAAKIENSMKLKADAEEARNQSTIVRME